jgi:hypothetical protein
VFTIIRLLYDAVLAIALSVVVAILCGSIAGVIVGASGPNLPISAIAFLLTGASLSFRLWRNSCPSVLPSVQLASEARKSLRKAT